MLCGIKTETVNTAVDAFLEEIDNVSLNSSIVCYKVRTLWNMTLNNCLNRTVVCIAFVRTGVGFSFLIELRLIFFNLIAHSLRPSFIGICNMVWNDIADDFDAVFVSLITKWFKIVLCAEPWLLCNMEADRLIKLPPLTCYIAWGWVVLWLLNGRSLNCCVSCRCNCGKVFFDCIVRPVECVEHNTVADLITKGTVGRCSLCGINLGSIYGGNCRKRRCQKRRRNNKTCNLFCFLHRENILS